MMLLKSVLATIQMTMTIAFVNAGDLYAESQANDRVALMLSGQNCSEHRQAIAQKLSQIPGVKRVDMDLIEDHILIDRLHDQRTAADFQAIVNGIIPPDGQCHAEIMESCISAGPIPPTPPQ
jgi:hypothetical protein